MVELGILAIFLLLLAVGGFIIEHIPENLWEKIERMLKL